MAKYDAIEWPHVLISTEMNVVQQRMHLRHAMKGVLTISARFVDSDSELSLDCSMSVLADKKNEVYILAAHNE